MGIEDYYRERTYRKSNNVKARLTKTMNESKSIVRQKLVANDFESSEFGKSEALSMPARHQGENRPDILRIIHLTENKIKIYERNGMVKEYKGEVTGKIYKTVFFHQYSYSYEAGTFLINYHRV